MLGDLLFGGWGGGKGGWGGKGGGWWGGKDDGKNKGGGGCWDDVIDPDGVGNDYLPYNFCFYFCFYFLICYLDTDEIHL